MKVSRKILVLCLISLILSSCEFFTQVDNYVTSIKFEGSNYSMKKDEIIALTLSANPTDSFSYYVPTYSISDDSVCGIIDRDETQIFIKGYKEGTVIVTAKLSNKTTKCIVKVDGE